MGRWSDEKENVANPQMNRDELSAHDLNDHVARACTSEDGLTTGYFQILTPYSELTE